MNVLTRIGTAVAAASCGSLLLIGCSSPTLTPGAGARESSAASGTPGTPSPCALVPPALLKQVLGITVPAGVEEDDVAAPSKCTYDTTDKTAYALVLSTDDPDFAPDDSFEGVPGTTRATAPGITRGLVAATGAGTGQVLVVKGGIAVTVYLDFKDAPQHEVFTSQQLQALVAAIAAELPA